MPLLKNLRGSIQNDAEGTPKREMYYTTVHQGEGTLAQADFFCLFDHRPHLLIVR